MDNPEMLKLKEKYHKNKNSRAKAIRNYCRYECCANDLISWRKCTLTGCFLHDFRLGRVQGIETNKTKKLTHKKCIKTPLNNTTGLVSTDNQTKLMQEVL